MLSAPCLFASVSRGSILHQLRANCNRLIALIRQAGFDFFTKILYFIKISSIPPPSAGGTNSNESIDYPPRCTYNKSEKLYYKARRGES